jgi:O-antigen ligase
MTLKEIIQRRDLSFYAGIICVALIAMYIHWLPPFMVAWVLFWIAETHFDFKFKEALRSKPGKLFLLFLVLFIWQMAGLLFTDSFASGFERMYKRLSFILFPLVLFLPGFRIKENVGLILRIFAISTLIYILYCFGNAIDNSITTHNGVKIFNPHPEILYYENFFFGNLFSDKVHPTYLSMYILISMLISLESFFDKALSVIKRVLWLTVIFLFLTVLYLLSSRAGILSAVVILPVYLLFRLYKLIPRYALYLIIVLIVSFTGILLKTNSRIQYSIEEVSKEKIHQTLETDTRFVIWKSAFGVIKNNLLFGVGTGDASKELKAEFLSRGYTDGYYDNLNAHNQFIEIQLENGLIGLAVFLTIIGFIAYISISEKNLILGLFLISMLIFFMFETLLNRHAGIAFFPIFTFLLLHYKPKTLNK